MTNTITVERILTLFLAYYILGTGVGAMVLLREEQTTKWVLPIIIHGTVFVALLCWAASQ